MEIYTPKEAAVKLKISVRTMSRLIKSNTISVSCISGKIKRITGEQLADYIEEKTPPKNRRKR